jgi:hypothetical protein
VGLKKYLLQYGHFLKRRPVLIDLGVLVGGLSTTLVDDTPILLCKVSYLFCQNDARFTRPTGCSDCSLTVLYSTMYTWIYRCLLSWNDDDQDGLYSAVLTSIL